MNSLSDAKRMRLLLEATGHAYAAGVLPSQPDWFEPLTAGDNATQELISHRMRLNGILSLAEEHFNAAGDLAYERLQADEGASNSWALGECSRRSEEAADLLSVGLAAMCCDDAEIVVRGGQEELLDWIKAMAEIREELVA